MRQFKIITFLLMLLPFIGASVYGEPENQISKDSRFEIDPKGEIVITATRTKDSLKQIGGNSVELITSEEIENSGKTSVRDILSQLSGVGLSSSGGPGSNVSVFIRGADSKNLLVLIDGIMINDPSTPNRQSDIGNLLLDDIERIELIKGSQSVLYGSNATAGVLNIITKIGRDKPSSYVKLEGGSYDTKKAQAGTKGKVGSLSYSVTGSKVISEGFSSASDRNERILHDGNTSEKDGWQNQSLSAALTYKIAKDHEISLMIKDVLSDVKTDDYGFGGYAVDHFDYNQFAPDPNAKKDQHIITQQRTTGLKYSSRLFDGKLESVLGINQSAKKREHFDNLNQKNLEFDGSYLDKYWQGSFFPLDQHEVTIGLSSMLEDMLQKSVTPTQSISDVDEQVTTSSLWIQDQMFFLEEKLVMVLGARRDDHEIYGKADSFRFAPSFNLEGSHTLLKASWGSGFRSPSLYELFGSYTYFGQTTIIGNQELTPERSLTFDYGVQQSFLGGDMKLNLTYFKSLFENKIDYVSDPVTFQGGYENLEGISEVKGLETRLDALINPSLRLNFHHTRLDARDAKGELLPRRPKDRLYFAVISKMGDRGEFNAAFRHVGKRPEVGAMDIDGNKVEELSAYSLIDLAASYRVGSSYKIHARIENLTDEVYEEAWSYATPGRSLYLGVKAEF